MHSPAGSRPAWMRAQRGRSSSATIRTEPACALARVGATTIPRTVWWVNPSRGSAAVVWGSSSSA